MESSETGSHGGTSEVCGISLCKNHIRATSSVHFFMCCSLKWVCISLVLCVHTGVWFARGCVGGNTLRSLCHAAGLQGRAGVGNDHTMMCFMGNNADLPLPLSPVPRDILAQWMLSFVAFLLRLSFMLTVCRLLDRSRMWTPASVSWTPEEWMYKGSQQKVGQFF